jgi:hypothetical protein
MLYAVRTPSRTAPNIKGPCDGLVPTQRARKAQLGRDAGTAVKSRIECLRRCSVLLYNLQYCTLCSPVQSPVQYHAQHSNQPGERSRLLCCTKRYAASLGGSTTLARLASWKQQTRGFISERRVKF